MKVLLPNKSPSTFEPPEKKCSSEVPHGVGDDEEEQASQKVKLDTELNINREHNSGSDQDKVNNCVGSNMGNKSHELDKLNIGWGKSIRESLRTYDLPENHNEIKATTQRQWIKTVAEKIEVKNK